MNDTQTTLEHSHIWTYRIYESDVEDVNPRTVETEVDGSATLAQILEAFEEYLTDVGYVLPDDTKLGFVPKDE